MEVKVELGKRHRAVPQVAEFYTYDDGPDCGKVYMRIEDGQGAAAVETRHDPESLFSVALAGARIGRVNKETTCHRIPLQWRDGPPVLVPKTDG